MAKVKGAVILNGRDFARAVAGDDAWDRVLERLGEDDRQALAAVIPVGWYDIRLYERTNRALVEVIGGAGDEVMGAAGRFAAEQDLRTTHRLFLRLANPAYVLERSTGYWRRFQDSGTWSIVRVPPDGVRATLMGWGARDELICVRLGAYMFRLFQLVGAKNGTLQRVTCVCRGDPACVFTATWD